MLIKNLISEVALRCGDAHFKEFDINTYKRVLYRANREIAKKYEIFKKLVSFKLREMVEDKENDIVLNINDFKEEYMVKVNGNTLSKVDNQIEPHYKFVYYMEFKEGRLYFNYTLGDPYYYNTTNITGLDITEVMSKGVLERVEDGDIQSLMKDLDDEIVIGYVSMPDLETEIGEYEIPTKFEEEQIEYSIFLIAKLGIAKFPSEDSEIGKKYKNLLSLYKSEKISDYDKFIAQDHEWIKVQPWSVI